MPSLRSDSDDTDSDADIGELADDDLQLPAPLVGVPTYTVVEYQTRGPMHVHGQIADQIFETPPMTRSRRAALAGLFWAASFHQ